MLKAILQNKTKERFQVNEDSLTSSVFQLLAYLPTRMMWRILRRAIQDKSLAKDVGVLEKMEYWSHWDAIHTTNANFVEPDVYLSFEEMDLIVEAKRYDHKQQYRGQWENELQGYCNLDTEERRTDGQVVLWALGGIHNLKTEEVQIAETTFKVVKSTWTMLLNSIQKEKQVFEKEKKAKGVNGVGQILEDLLTSFALHGFFIGNWLEENQYAPYQQRNQEWSYLLNHAEKYDSEKWLETLPAFSVANHSLNTLSISWQKK
jgi:hypothetical protein